MPYLAGAAAQLHETIGSGPSLVEDRTLDPYLNTARQALGEVAEQVFAEGRAMPLEQAIAYALERE